MIGNIITWLLLGLVAGWLAKIILPGKQGGGLIMTTILGIVGAMVGGFLAGILNLAPASGFNFYSIFTAVGGAIVVLLVYGMVTKKR